MIQVNVIQLRGKACKQGMTYAVQPSCKKKIKRMKLLPRNPNGNCRMKLPSIRQLRGKASQSQVANKDPLTKYNVLPHLKKVPALLSVYDALPMSKIQESLIHALCFERISEQNRSLDQVACLIVIYPLTRKVMPTCSTTTSHSLSRVSSRKGDDQSYGLPKRTFFTIGLTLEHVNTVALLFKDSTRQTQKANKLQTIQRPTRQLKSLEVPGLEGTQ